MKVAIIGYGFVGKATHRLLGKTPTFTEVLIHDPKLGHEVKNWSGVEYAFICVPTNLKDGKLDVSIVHTILKTLPEHVQPVIRSTLGPDQTLYIVEQFYPCPIIMPEFLREKHWKDDVDNNDIPIILGDYVGPLEGAYAAGAKLQWALASLNRRVKVVNPMTASMIKIGRNAALAMKVALANDFYDICKNTGADFDSLISYLKEDPNLGGTHWDVPGHDDKRGFGGTCLPKDLTHTSSLCYHTNNIMDTAIKANKERRSDYE